MSRVLIVEDEPVIRMEARRMLTRAGYDVAEAASVQQAEADHDLASFDLVLSDLRLPGSSGTELIAKCAPSPVVIMTSYATVRSAVDAMKQGAADYLAKPFDNDELLLLVERVLRQGRLERQNVALKRDVERDYETKHMVGSCPAMEELFSRVRKVAPTAATVLILGESGTGKELVARAIHEQSTRSDAPLVAVNCAAIPEGLIESELFGHEKGAFTGAQAARTGLVEAADGGTLFLDEIGELPAAAQARLLRVLQEGEVRKVGATRSRKVDVRVVAATHRDLPAMVREGTFRQDLFFRLRVMEIVVPPLRERGVDVRLLAEHLLARAVARMHAPKAAFTPDALAAIDAHPWPGNVRELENAIERAVILCETGRITPELLGIDPAGDDTSVGTEGDSLEDYFRRFVREHEATMSETELARALGISRKSLWERRHRLGLPRRRTR